MRRALFALSLSLLTAAPLAAGAQTRPAITGLAFFRDYTTQTAAAEKFYGPTMGFPEMKSPDGTLVFPVNKSQWVEVLTTPDPKPNDRMAAVGFTVRDVHAMERYLNAKGYPTAEPMHDNEFAVKDPEGYLVYFVESPYPTATGDKTLAGIPKMVAASQPLPSATSHRMIHAGFVVNDRSKEDVFWKQTLGFKPYWHGWQKDPAANGDDYVSMQVPDGTDWIEYMLNQHNPDLRQTGVMNHFSLGTEHMQTVLAQLQKNECTEKACTSIQAGRDGKIQLNLYDPDLTRVEYMEFSNAMKPCCSDFTGTMPGPRESE
ncbi:MAG TPA: VOC family protein [Acidobacteriaceae bacterium]|nr:VOC family protein [Acidobacteriaceae bacterium]